MTRTSMSDLAYDIEQLYIEGFNPYSIAAQLGCPLDLVFAWFHENHVDAEYESDDYYGA